MMSTNEQKAALWQCDGCGTWWCSQAAIEPTTFILELSPDLLEELGWENFRGWRLGGTPHVATCGDCREVSSVPLCGEAPVAAQLRVRLAMLLNPVERVPA